MHTNYSKRDADPSTTYIYLNHPCRDVDVWYNADKQVAEGQGYKSLADLRAMEARNREMLNALDALATWLLCPATDNATLDWARNTANAALTIARAQTDTESES